MNPLLAVQFTKDEYGEKVVKPFVNFHVTPNRNIVQKLGHLLSHKKQTLFESYGPSYAPHYPPKPIEFYEKPYYVNPSGPSFHHYSYRETPPYPHRYSNYYRDDDDVDNDNYDYNYDYEENYHGIARSNDKISTDHANGSTIPKKTTDGKVFFPNRRKRDVQSEARMETKRITEVSIGDRN